MNENIIRFIAPVILLIMATLIILIRIRSLKKPASIKKIIIPPIGMSTGFGMFLLPMTHIPIIWAVCSFLSGVVFLSIPLMLTTKFKEKSGNIYVEQSKAFLLIFIGLMVTRVALRTYIEQYISIYQTGAIFFILAFGMLLPWRLYMLYMFNKIQKKPGGMVITQES